MYLYFTYSLQIHVFSVYLSWQQHCCISCFFFWKAFISSKRGCGFFFAICMEQIHSKLIYRLVTSTGWSITYYLVHKAVLIEFAPLKWQNKSTSNVKRVHIIRVKEITSGLVEGFFCAPYNYNSAVKPLPSSVISP